MNDSAKSENQEEQATSDIPAALPILPLRHGVLFPVMMLPMEISEESFKRPIEEAATKERIVGIFTLKEEEQEKDNPEFHQTGTAAMIMRMLRTPGGSLQVILQGRQRIQRRRRRTQAQQAPAQPQYAPAEQPGTPGAVSAWWHATRVDAIRKLLGRRRPRRAGERWASTFLVLRSSGLCGTRSMSLAQEETGNGLVVRGNGGCRRSTYLEGGGPHDSAP